MTKRIIGIAMLGVPIAYLCWQWHTFAVLILSIAGAAIIVVWVVVGGLLASGKGK